MAKYVVTFRATDMIHVEVEADDYDDAVELATDIVFDHSVNADWEYSGIEEIDE